MSSDLQRDIERIDLLIRGGWDATSVERQTWQRIKNRITELEQQVEDLGYEVIEAGERYRCDCG